MKAGAPTCQAVVEGGNPLQKLTPQMSSPDSPGQTRLALSLQTWPRAAPSLMKGMTQAVKLNALATGQPPGLAITHCLPPPLPAAPSPPCQAALMPPASSCQQMFVWGVAGRQLNRACVCLAPGPRNLPSQGFAGFMCQSHVSHSTEKHGPGSWRKTGFGQMG